MTTQATPGDWQISPHKQSSQYTDIVADAGTIGDEEAYRPICRVHRNMFTDNAKLIASAKDHALFASSLIHGVIRWEFFHASTTDGEVCAGGMRYPTKLDEFGVPILNRLIRAAIEDQANAD